MANEKRQLTEKEQKLTQKQLAEAQYVGAEPSQREKMLDVLNQATMTLFSRGGRDFEDAMTEGIDLIAGIADLDRMSVFRNSEQPNGLYLSQIYRWKKDAGGTIDVLPSLAHIAYSTIIPHLEEILRNGECVSCPIHLMPEAKTFKHFGCVEVLVVPVYNDSKFWGFTVFEKLKEERFTAQETDTLRSASFMLAVALMRNEELREIEHKTMLLRALNRIASLILPSRADTLEENLQQSLCILAEVSGADRVYIWKNYRRDDCFYCSQIYECSDGAKSQRDYALAVEMSYDDIVPGLAERFSQGHCLNGIVRLMPENEQAALVPQGILSILIVPIFLENQFWGFIGFDDCHRERVFSENDEIILRSASEMIAGALSRTNLEMEVEKIFYDPLTNIYNRRFFDENIQRLIQALSRSGSSLTLMMIDVDHFKQYNDIYGHIKGDSCLKVIAETLRGSMARGDDFVARYGGEEFVAVLPNTDEAGARTVARQMLEKVRDCGIFHEKSGPTNCVTISVGVTAGLVAHTHSGNDFVLRADEMLYVSKQNGRNRYTFGTL